MSVCAVSGNPRQRLKSDSEYHTLHSQAALGLALHPDSERGQREQAWKLNSTLCWNTWRLH